MEECHVGGKLKKLNVADSGVVLEIESDYSREVRLQRDDPLLTLLDILEGFVGECVDITIRCYSPHPREKTKKTLGSTISEG